jgi:anti-sigma B factor antagonist
MDSSGIGELVAGFTDISNRGGPLKLVNLTRRVKDLLQMTQVLTIFEVLEDEATAIRSYAEIGK